MIGITSYGGYIPRLRLDRMSIYQGMGWFAPAIVLVAQGERSFGYWDEDALTMAVAAARDCLVGQDKASVDALYLASTTLPFADRLNAGIVKTALNLRDDMQAADFTSSLRAGTTALSEAMAGIQGGRYHNVLVSASDMRRTKTAYFYEMWFGDGAAAVTLGDKGVIAEFLGAHSVTHDFVDHYRGSDAAFDYMWEERWVRDEGYAKIIPEAVNGLFSRLSLTMEDVDRLVFPCFFKKDHKNIAKGLGATPDMVPDNMHEQCGETGAAHPLVMLVRALEQAEPGERILVCGFGQGCDALYFRVTDKIKKMQARQGITGSLDRGVTTDNYTKFLKFRDLIQTETGIRAESPTKTAKTVLWRKRDMLSALVGGKCTECNTPQFPRMDICVNPDCRAQGTQEPYEFADMSATVKSFTGDLLAISVDPPACYGMVQFDGGGRFLADFTDCAQDDLYVGQKVTMSFRRRYVDTERGFSGYFWKAVPVPGDKPAKATDQIRFDGQVAIVTGAGAGLGRSYALALASRGAKVVVNDLGGAADGSGASQKAADAVVAEIVSAGGEAVASYDSVATVAGGEAIVNTAVEAFGGVDILINNAGILRDKSLVKMEPEDWKAVRAVHLDGAYNVTRPAFLKMREAKYGRIVMTSSSAGLYGNFGQTNYSAAKLGLVGLMNTLELEGDKYNIKVNTVAPVATTRLTEELLPANLHEKLQPEFVTPLVVHLSSKGNKDSGMIFNAGMGYYNRAAVVAGPGAVPGEGAEVPTMEQVHKAFEAIDDLSETREFDNATAAFGPMMDAFAPKKKDSGDDEDDGGSVAAVFAAMPDAFLADKAEGVEVTFQYEITGEGGGQWYSVIASGTCEVFEGTHEAPTTTIIMASDDFLALMGGTLNPMQAYTTGKLKIEGDLMKSQLIEKLFEF